MKLLEIKLESVQNPQSRESIEGFPREMTGRTGETAQETLLPHL